MSIYSLTDTLPEMCMPYFFQAKIPLFYLDTKELCRSGPPLPFFIFAACSAETRENGVNDLENLLYYTKPKQ